MDPFEEGTLFLFCGHNRSCIKGLIYEGDGYAMITKRLSDTDEAKLLSLEAFRRLMDGFAVELSTAD